MCLQPPVRLPEDFEGVVYALSWIHDNTGILEEGSQLEMTYDPSTANRLRPGIPTMTDTDTL